MSSTGTVISPVSEEVLPEALSVPEVLSVPDVPEAPEDPLLSDAFESEVPVPSFVCPEAAELLPVFPVPAVLSASDFLLSVREEAMLSFFGAPSPLPETRPPSMTARMIRVLRRIKSRQLSKMISLLILFFSCL
jgi:hypothetical protein